MNETVTSSPKVSLERVTGNRKRSWERERLDFGIKGEEAWTAEANLTAPGIAESNN